MRDCYTTFFQIFSYFWCTVSCLNISEPICVSKFLRCRLKNPIMCSGTYDPVMFLHCIICKQHWINKLSIQCIYCICDRHNSAACCCHFPTVIRNISIIFSGPCRIKLHKITIRIYIFIVKTHYLPLIRLLCCFFLWFCETVVHIFYFTVCQGTIFIHWQIFFIFYIFDIKMIVLTY